MIADVGLVGRRDQLDELGAWIVEAQAGTPVVVLMEGEAGVGKTRLVDELLVRLPSGTRVLRGRCQEDASVPYLPLALALRSLVTGWDVSGHVDDASVESERGDRRLALFLDVSRTLLDLAASELVVLVLDDVHWADAATLELIGHVLASASVEASSRPVQLFVLLAQRPTTPHPHVARAMERFRREPIARELRLRGLEQLDVHDLIEAAMGDRPSRDLMGAILEASSGNPLLVLALLDRLDSFGALRVREGFLERSTAAELTALPQGLDSLLLERIDTVSVGCRDLLTRIAFLGDDVDRADVALVSGLDEHELAPRLAEARRAGILAEDEACRFTHPQLRQLLYHRPGGRRRAALHRDLAERLQQQHGDDDSYAPTIAHHLRLAGAEADPDQVARYGVLAAGHAASVGAWSETWQLYEAVLEATAPTLPEPSGFGALLHHRAAVAAWRDFDNRRALAHADDAVEQARALGDLERWGLAAVIRARVEWANGAEALGTPVRLDALTEFLEEAGESHPAVRAEAHAVLVQALVHQNEPDRAHPHAVTAWKLAQELEDDQLLRWIEAHIAYVHLGALDLDEALVWYRRGGGRPFLPEDPHPSVWTTNRLGFTEWLIGDLDAAEQSLALGRERAHRSGMIGEQGFAVACLAAVAGLRGDHDLVERHGERAELLYRWSDHPWVAVVAYPVLAASRARRGDRAGAHSALDTYERVGGRGAWRYRLLVDLDTGADDAVAATLAERPLRAKSLDRPITLLEIASNAAELEIASRTGAHDVAALLIERLEPAVAAGVVQVPGWPAELPELLTRARTAQTG